MKLKHILISSVLVAGFSNAQDIMKESMSTMQDGMTQVQQGFLNNNITSIKEGIKLIKKGNTQFSNPKVIKQS